MKYFLEYRCQEKSVNNSNDMEEQAKLILDKNPYIIYVLVSGSVNLGKALFYRSVMDVNQYQETMRQCKNILMQKGIYTYLVRIPDSQEIIEEKRHKEWKFGYFTAPINWSVVRKKDMEHYLHNFTELGYEDTRKNIMHKEICSIYGERENKTIFIVGPCIVAGWDNLTGESLPAILYEQLKQAGLQYKVQKVIVPENADANLNAILEFDIRQNDIVIWITDCMDKEVADLDLTNMYNQYDGYKWLYADVPIHTTKTGNEMVVYELIRNIIKPAVNKSDESDIKLILHTGEKQLTCREQDELRLYIEKIKKINFIQHGIIGACVVTCNPFTKGHYHLIKYASEHVDFLYVFIVEEDEFFVPFSDRIEMVRKGTAKIDNVIVLPSGSFMISEKTFKNYFEKEIQQDVIIFKNYIAPAIMITKRFVGEEPEDYITAQYNQLLKEKLGGGGRIDVIEIPRIKEEGKAISASKVRRCMENKDWNEIERMVPKTTLEYLKANLTRFQQKRGDTVSHNIRKIINCIQSHQNIVICGMGIDAQKVMWQLDWNIVLENYKNVIFYDKKIALQNQLFRGRNVIGIKDLAHYKDYHFVICSRNFKIEIFYDLTQNGIDADHILVFDEVY